MNIRIADELREEWPGTAMGILEYEADVTPSSKELLKAFGSLKAILEARPEQLLRVDGMNRTRASLIAMMIPMARVWMRSANEKPDMIRNTREAEKYCKSLLIGERVEKLYVIALNVNCKILGHRQISSHRATISSRR